MDISFCKIAAINLTQLQSATVYEKRIGYLSACLFLSEGDELVLLLVNGLQRDLTSTSYLDVILALTAITNLANQDIASSLFPHLESCLVHEHDLVRRKAVLAMSKLYDVAPDIVMAAFPQFKRLLADPDPAVMCASLVLLRDVARDQPLKCRPLTTAFIHIILQIRDGRLPHGFDYHGMSAPWALSQCVEILGSLGQVDIKTSDKIRPVLLDLLKQVQSGDDAAFGIILSCIQALSKLSTSTEPSAEQILYTSILKRCLSTSQNANLMYLGIEILQAIRSTHAEVISAFRNDIMVCLEHVDDTLRSRTLDLVYSLTTPASSDETIKLIVKALPQSDTHRQINLLDKLQHLISTQLPMSQLTMLLDVIMALDDDRARPRLTGPISRLLIDDQDGDVKEVAVGTCYRVLGDANGEVARNLGRLFVWIIGEYSQASSLSHHELTQVLAGILRDSHDHELAAQTIESIKKIVVRSQECSSQVMNAVSSMRTSKYLDVQQKLVEFAESTRNLKIIDDALTSELLVSTVPSPESPFSAIDGKSPVSRAKPAFSIVGKSSPTTSLTTPGRNNTSPTTPKNSKLSLALFGDSSQPSVLSQSLLVDVSLKGDLDVPLIPSQTPVRRQADPMANPASPQSLVDVDL
ncbi:hypothetical protein SmJEL517_g06198 [Synchytrium microbalum]|uniref:Clathrin/coatomer adaptor adaptin-like N-terminal domain-containing protein n=1 Tax=Synchytrium microbalum TaxID=1806994 RepID=A0A507BRM8_9FUNG|nr:uncharacterized protein SmJEL517_g06198 [Synchytrium microbalum]TPX30178.1 hypothetical protein SmJEL517_g06198 [Synchytrium microbalum]